MRSLMKIFVVLLLFVLSATSCQRRDFADKTTGISLELTMHVDFEGVGNLKIPELMRVDLYNATSGDLEYTIFVSSEGGTIHPKPGDYDMVVYNIDTESTQVRNGFNINDIEAITSDVSAFLKGQLSQFLAKRAQARKERLEKLEKERQEKEQMGNSSLSDAETSAPSIPIERIVYEPDHLFVGRTVGLNVPVVYEGQQRTIVAKVDVQTVIETWTIEVTNIKGLQWIRSAVAIMSGQVESHYIGTDRDSDAAVSIYFEDITIDRENNAIIGTFNTFGKHPDEISELSLDINLVDTNGEEHHFHFDVTSEFFDNPEQVIEVDVPIEIEEPKVEGGGFVPSVGDWETEYRDIIL